MEFLSDGVVEEILLRCSVCDVVRWLRVCKKWQMIGKKILPLISNLGWLIVPTSHDGDILDLRNFLESIVISKTNWVSQ
jgi:hypothetical protein